MIEITIFETRAGERPFEKWFARVDRHARNRLLIAFEKLENGNTGNLKSLGEGIWELKVSFGPGYRVYLGWEGEEIVVLLHGGTKKRQSHDIARAKDYWRLYLAERHE